jgi:hypothetical protein
MVRLAIFCLRHRHKPGAVCRAMSRRQGLNDHPEKTATDQSMMSDSFIPVSLPESDDTLFWGDLEKVIRRQP